MTERLSRLNFRDLGGLETASGGVVRPGLLFRCEGPASFAAEHHAELAALGIRLVCDLRSEKERDHAPNDWAAQARLLNLNVTDSLRTTDRDGWAALIDKPSGAGALAVMRKNYEAMPGAIQPHLRALADAVIGGESPLLIHCTAGKDRTGVLVALLLTLLDVPWDSIMADYQRSEVFGRTLRLGGSVIAMIERTMGFTPTDEVIDALVGVHPSFLLAAFEAVERQWGSVPGYFADAGIDDDRRDALRGALVGEGLR